MLSMCDDFVNYFYKFLVWYGLISGTGVSRMHVYLLINRSVISFQELGFREGEILNLVLISDIQMFNTIAYTMRTSYQ